MAFGRTLSIELNRKSEKGQLLNVPSTPSHGRTDTLEAAVELAASRSAIPERRPSASTLFLSALAAIALYFCYLIASPFRAPILLAVMIAIVFHQVHVRIQQCG
jgi:hypothetical protein